MGDILARDVITKQPIFLEVKSSAKDDLTDSEQKFSEVFRRNWFRVDNLEQALTAIGVLSPVKLRTRKEAHE